MKRRTGLLSMQLAGMRKHLLLLGFFSLVLGVAIAGQAALLATAVDRIFAKEEILQSVAPILWALLAVMAIRTIIAYGNGRIGLRMAARAKTDIRKRALRKLVNDSIPQALGGQTGGKVSIVLDAVDETDSYFSQYMPRMMEMALIPVILLIFVFFLHAPSGWIMLVSAPFIPLFMILVGLQTRKKSEEKFAQLAEFSATFMDSLQGLVTLKLFGRVDRRKAEIEQSSLGFRDATMGILRIAFTNSFMLELVVMLSIGLIALELAIRLLVFNSLSFETAFLILLLAPEFYSVLKNTGTAFHGGRTAMGAARKVEDLINETANGHEEADRSEGTETANSSKISGLSLADTPPSLEVRNLRFSYTENGFTLDSGAATVAPREQIAIVGKSGSGKTTLLHLIAGLLQPSSGEVRVNGQPLEAYEEKPWFDHVSYITQHPYIFAGTFSDNIAIGTGRPVERADIEQAAESAGLAGLVAELGQGYDTVVGEGGRGLSGGEKQRLALARAFLHRPSVLLFDEPTVGLDLQTERILQQSICELARNATVITVAHRLHTIRRADRIWFMVNGTVVDSGSHNELLTRLPQYAEMTEVHRKGGLG